MIVIVARSLIVLSPKLELMRTITEPPLTTYEKRRRRGQDREAKDDDIGCIGLVERQRHTSSILTAGRSRVEIPKATSGGRLIDLDLSSWFEGC
jgi:hypothetical protein